MGCLCIQDKLCSIFRWLLAIYAPGGGGGERKREAGTVKVNCLSKATTQLFVRGHPLTLTKVQAQTRCRYYPTESYTQVTSSLTDAKILLMAASSWKSVAPWSMLALNMYAIDWNKKRRWSNLLLSTRQPKKHFPRTQKKTFMLVFDHSYS